MRFRSVRQGTGAAGDGSTAHQKPRHKGQRGLGQRKQRASSSAAPCLPSGLTAATALHTSCEVSRRVGTVRGDCSCAAATAWASAAAVVTARWGRCHAPHGSGVRHAAAGARPLLLAAAQERSRAAAAARRQASGGALAIAISAPIAGGWWCTSSGKRWPGSVRSGRRSRLAGRCKSVRSWPCMCSRRRCAPWARCARMGSGIGLVVWAPSQGRRLPCPHSDHRSACPPCRRPPPLTTLHDNPLFSQLPPRPLLLRTACAVHLGGWERVRGGAALTVPRRRLWQSARRRSAAPERGADDLGPHSGTRQTDGRALEAAGRANPGVGLCPAAVERCR